MTRKILIVDNDDMTLELFDIMLSKLGFEIIKTKEGQEALDKIKIEKFNLILLDDNLPKLTGFEITRKIRKSSKYEKNKDTPILMLSELDNPKDKVMGFELGVDDYITKPFNFSELLARIHNILKHRELSNQLTRREKRLLLLELLNTNLKAITTHIKKPLKSLYDESKKVDFKNESSVKKFLKSFDLKYNEAIATIESIEDEVNDLELEKDNLLKEELTIEELEAKINKHIKEMSPS